GLADPGGTDHQDVLGSDLAAQRLAHLHPAPAVAQRDRDGALRLVLADDVLVELLHDLARRHLRHISRSVSQSVRPDAACSSSMTMFWFVNTQISPAIRRAFSVMARASRSVFLSSARAAACANGPPDPIAIRSFSGSITSPLPDMMNELSRSATQSSASSRRRRRSVRQSLASSIAARVRLP